MKRRIAQNNMKHIRLSSIRTNRLRIAFRLLAMALMSWCVAFSGRGLGEDVPGKELLKHGPRPARPELAPSKLPMSWIRHERIALIGNSTAERMNLFGHFETYLHLATTDHELVVRNFGFPADEVANQQRSGNYDRLDDPLDTFGADTFLCFFGFNESFAGPDGVETFQASYRGFVERLLDKYRRDGTGAKGRVVLFTPIANEDPNDPLAPNAAELRANLESYSQAVQEVGRQLGVPVIDLFTESAKVFDSQPGLQFTINGVHVNELGDELVGKLAVQALCGAPNPKTDMSIVAAVRDAVNDKSWVHLQDYRMLNGWYVYGGRRTWDHETFPREYNKIRRMAELRDELVWARAKGQGLNDRPRDEESGELIVPPTRFGDPRQSYSEPKELRYLTPEECIATMEVPQGFEVKLFADERMFPELAKPVQMTFDNRGRLWVACMPTYPQWRPGDKRPDDRLLILEDTNADGVADKCTVFYDKLHCPTGFEFFNGGVLVVDQPRLVWLKDNDGDDRADQIVHVLDGWGTDDTHHTIGAFESSHGGLLYMLEGVSMSTTVETPWGPKRWQGAAGAFILNPRTLELSRFTTPGYGNPWCMVFDPWGQGVIGDGTGSQQHWASGLSGAQIGPRRGLDAIFDNQGMRPSVGSEFLYTRHFPASVQGQFTYGCVINMNGLPRFHVENDGAGFSGYRIMRDGRADDLIRSTDKNFRPTDPQIGPDGALWFGDWCNALIGHMQYSQRDPNRDHTFGRIYRLVYPELPLVQPVTQFGKSELELLDQFREYEPRTRNRVRTELANRPTEKVVAAIKTWLASIKENDLELDRLRCEALWVLQRHHIVDRELMRQVLASERFEARAAGIHYISDMQRWIPEAIEYLEAAASDEHPRVRAEAARALSFIPTERSVKAVLAIASSPMDKWLAYVVEHAIAALESTWTPMLSDGSLSSVPEKGLEKIDAYLASARPGLTAQRHIATLLDPNTKEVARENAYGALMNLRGNARNGQAVFARVCANCHKVQDKGYNFGPELTDVGRRLSKHDLIESIVDPNAKMDKKYLTEIILTEDGVVYSGFIASETDSMIHILLPEGKEARLNKGEISDRKTAMQSSMPENLAATIAASEFLDLIEYLTTLK